MFTVYTYTYALKKFYDILIIASDIHSKKAKKIIFNKKLLAELFFTAAIVKKRFHGKSITLLL